MMLLYLSISYIRQCTFGRMTSVGLESSAGLTLDDWTSAGTTSECSFTVQNLTAASDYLVGGGVHGLKNNTI